MSDSKNTFGRRKSRFQKRKVRDLGFGKHVMTRGRMMNPDGSFNVFRDVPMSLNDIYFKLIRMPWLPFFGLIVLSYLVVNVFFAFAYVALDVSNLSGIESRELTTDFQEAFFFSSQTLTTVGYGRVSPMGFWVNIVASFESLIGLMSFGLMSGLLYGRFSRPVARILFSKHMLVAPYRGGQGLMIRLMNGRKSELLNMTARIMIAYNKEGKNGQEERRFHTLDLELSNIAFFTMSWTLVHGLDDNSPIQHLEKEDYIKGNAEFLVLLRGTDESTEQVVTARRSYSAKAIVWGARFLPAIERGEDNILHVISEKLDAYEPADLPKNHEA